MKTFKLTDVQAEAILNMRLRNLRKLEEFEIRKEDKELRAEKKVARRAGRLREEAVEEDRRADQELKEKYGRKTPLGKRRTDFAEAPEHDEAAIEEAMVVREPITGVLSDKGWVRALRGHVEDLSNVAFKQDDKLKLAFFAETTSKFLMLGTNGRFYTIEAAKLPGGRGHGEPMRLFIDLEQEADIVTMFPFQGGRKFIVASHQGRGFVVAEEECLGTTRKGKTVLNVKAPDEARAVRDRRGRSGRRHRRQSQDADLPARSIARDGARRRRAAAALQGRRAVRREGLQGHGRPDLDRRRGRAFSLTLKELADWRGNRADAGRLAPKGFPAQQQVQVASRGGD
jgi:topoisomerase-4 subunit A